MSAGPVGSSTEARVAALYRYPVKGFTAESVPELTLTGDGRATGDRVWSLRFPTGAKPEQRDGLDYWPKGEGLCLRDFPSLARLRLTYDGATGRMRILGGGGSSGSASYSTRVEADRARLVADLTAFVQGSAEGRRLEPNLPLQLVGDGATSQFQDRSRGFLAAHSRSSLAGLSRALGTEVDERRFRSNIAIEGLPAWSEYDLIGERVTIGGAEFTVHAPIVRCLAVNANPDNGERDLRVLQALTRELGQDKPTFGILLLPTSGQEGAEIRLGDAMLSSESGVTTSRVRTTGAAPGSRPR